MQTTRTAVLGTTLALALGMSGCGSKGAQQSSSAKGGPEVLSIGASMSLTGKLAREGALTKEGYSVCQDVVNSKGGIPVGASR